MIEPENRNAMKQIHLLLPLLIFILYGCARGEKALQKGKYDQALRVSANRLKRHSSDTKAQKVFMAAHKETERIYQSNIQRYIAENQPFKWESVLYQYQQLQKNQEALTKCKACLELLNSPPNSYAEIIEKVKTLAADERYQAGLEAFKHKDNRAFAEEAFDHFLKVKQLSKSYKDVDDNLISAKEYAVLRIVIEPLTEDERLSDAEYEYLQKQMDEEFFENRSPHELVRFQNPAAAQEDSLPSHHVLRIYFTGQSSLRESTGSTDVTVESSTKYKVGTKKINDTTLVDVMEPVKGTLTTNYRKREKNAELEYEIIDLDNDCVIHRDGFRGSAEWKEEWETFSGDERALNGKVLTSSPTLFPASDWDLFKDISRSAARQIYYRIHYFYKKPLPVYTCLPKNSR